MPTLNTATDLFVTYRFLRALTTPFNKTDAYKLGIIDERGAPLKKKRELVSSNEKSAYTMFDRMVFRLKRLIEKLPMGKTRLASFAAALWLIKEETNCDIMVLESKLNKHYNLNKHLDKQLVEHFDYDRILVPGKYQITNDFILELFDIESDIVTIDTSNNTPQENILGCHLYNASHPKRKIVVSHEDIKRIS